MANHGVREVGVRLLRPKFPPGEKEEPRSALARGFHAVVEILCGPFSRQSSITKIRLSRLTMLWKAVFANPSYFGDMGVWKAVVTNPSYFGNMGVS